MEKMTSKAKAYLRSHIRMAWRYYSTNRHKIKHSTDKCPKCDKPLTVKTVKVDHIVPVGKFVAEENPYIVKMFASIDNLMGLCKPCHAKKTKLEAAQRAKERKSAKDAA